MGWLVQVHDGAWSARREIRHKGCTALWIPRGENSHPEAHHPLPEGLPQAVTRLRVSQKGRQSSVEKEKGCRGGHRGS